MLLHQALVTLMFLSRLNLTSADNYSDLLTFFNEKLRLENYNPQIRPLFNQSQPLMVNVSFVLKSIVEVNEASQKFTCNGLFQFKWTDEILAWIIKTSNIKNEIQPLPENIWRPRVMIVNTLEDRELFHEHLGSMTIFNIGTVRWVPVSLFPTTCQLDLTYYPFDQQTCYLQLVSIPHNAEELQFTVRFPRAKILDYMIHGEWDLKKTEVQTKLVYVGTTTRSLIEVTIVMKRRPTCFIFNILLPVVLLSFLNIFVFVIPAESGEKISYGLTMLLALSVYLSTVSGMIPRSSLTLPNVIIYLFLLLFLSLITVISSIIVVLLHNKKEKEGKQQGVTETSSAPWGKVNYVRLAITSGPNTGNGVPIQYPEMKAALNKEHKVIQGPNINKYKVLGRHINLLLFLIFLVIYIAITLCFTLNITSV